VASFVKRFLAIALAFAALFLGARWLWHALASDERKIRWLVEGAADGFDEAHSGPVLDALTLDWLHESTPGFDRAVLVDVLRALYFQERDPSTRRFRYRVEIDAAALAIAVEGERARLAGEARFDRSLQGEWKPIWRVRFEADLIDGDDGWRVARSRHEDLEGRGL
jgi:hypothetical protein